MRWLAFGGLWLLTLAGSGCGGGEPTGGDCTPRTEDFVDDRLVPASQLAEASKTGELVCALICPTGTTACEELGPGGGMVIGGAGPGGTSGIGGGGSTGGNTAAGTGGAPSGDARVVRCSGTVSYPCG